MEHGVSILSNLLFIRFIGTARVTALNTVTADIVPNWFHGRPAEGQPNHDLLTFPKLSIHTPASASSAPTPVAPKPEIPASKDSGGQ